MPGRTALAALAAALMGAGLMNLDAQTPAAPPAGPRELARHTLTGPFDGFDALLLELRPPPGTGRDHKHTGPVLGYVLEGKVRFGVDHGPEQIIAAGETFFEPTGVVHSTFGSADATPAHVLVFMVVPKGTERRDGGVMTPQSLTAPQTSPDRSLGVIARRALAGALEGYELVLSRSAMRYFTGTSTPVHRHPGIVLAFVLEGRVRFAINNEPEQVIPIGGTFFEPLGAVHTTSGSASADEATRILVFELRPKEQA